MVVSKITPQVLRQLADMIERGVASIHDNGTHLVLSDLYDITIRVVSRELPRFDSTVDLAPCARFAPIQDDTETCRVCGKYRLEHYDQKVARPNEPSPNGICCRCGEIYDHPLHTVSQHPSSHRFLSKQERKLSASAQRFAHTLATLENTGEYDVRKAQVDFDAAYEAEIMRQERELIAQFDRFLFAVKAIVITWAIASEYAITKLSEMIRVIVAAWSSDVVDDTMRRFALLETT